jgi:two-component system KDP operon response regulator KdpE
MAETLPVVLLVEDEPQMRRFLRASLPGHGYRLLEATTAAEALSMATQWNPDLVLLDLGLPDLDGLVVTERLRKWTKTPILVLSARGQESDKIAALDAGADDYLTKPFGIGELLARMRVALRHAARTPEAESACAFGDVRVDLVKREVSRGVAVVHLTPREYKLLVILAKNADRVVTHRQLLREVWGPNAVEQTHYLRVYMAQLRQKLEVDPARPRYLTTEAGVGYRLRVEAG